MDKSLVGHAVLAVAAAVSAYAAWNKPASGRHDPQIVVVAGSTDRLTKVDWDEGGFHVTLDKTGDTLAVSSTVKNAKDEKRNVSGFPATDKGEELVKKLAPLKAERSLGRPDAARLKEVGLEKPTQTLTLSFGDTATKLEVGDASFGSGSYYARNEAGEVFLLPSETILPLRSGAAGLIERMATNVTRDHVEQVVVTSGGATRTLLHKNAADRAQSFFADKATPDLKIEKANAWVDALLRFRALGPATEMPVVEPKVSAVIHSDDGRDRSINVYEPAGETAVVVSTTFPKGVLVSKSSAEQLIKDVKNVFGP